MTKSTSKDTYDVISVTSSPLRHRKTSPKLCHKFFFPIWAPPNQNFLLRQWEKIWPKTFLIFRKIKLKSFMVKGI